MIYTNVQYNNSLELDYYYSLTSNVILIKKSKGYIVHGHHTAAHIQRESIKFELWKKRSNPHLDTYQRMESPYGLARQLDIAHIFAELYYKYGPVWTGFPWSLQQTKLSTDKTYE